MVKCVHIMLTAFLRGINVFDISGKVFNCKDIRNENCWNQVDVLSVLFVAWRGKRRDKYTQT